MSTAPSLHPRLRVRFMNQVGAEEAGVDGGGLSREFLSELIMNGFDPTRGFFVYTAEKTLYPNPQASVLYEDYLKHYYFLGRMLAKAVYEGMLVELQFAHFFLAKIVSRSGGGVGFDYLHSLDPELYRQLRYLKSYEGNVADLSLDFTVTRSTFGESETIELKPGGRQIPVTEENRVEYMHLMAYYKLNKQIHPQVRAFVAGLNDVIRIDWLRLFDADELQTLISGADTVIDIDDLRKHTVYPRDTADCDETLEHFWDVLRTLSEADKRLFLRFVTACSRPPMFGFRDLQPPFSIQVTNELDRLPTASTCMNLLRLPNIRDPDVLRERLLYALHANAGFEYS
ncbi:putative Ubiquitin protein ligase [Fasciolopsis buskii]|uniref:HECT-type E3 ubiquitin transferase n=1 Tax=Fasciolopsis buskii TaxID=27845 RepID=A0A8E0RLE9_9TREM|nr:putative Ubiquitin protein ligase [Fasciolopsis buski]